MILIIGAGPCGLACGRELDRLGHGDWLILERHDRAGGLARSVVDPAGFTWDMGGHVVFSHFGEFDALLAETMGDDVLHHDRSSYVRFADRWVPYPFQNNLRHLPPEVTAECLEGLEAAPGGHSGMDFATWMAGVFGAGITRHFMAPYNTKVWATDPAEMAAGWIAERVAVVDHERAARNVREGRDDLAWGPNNTFVFPAYGGTGEIYTRLASRFADRIRYDQEVVAVDPAAGRVRTSTGEEHRYDALVSTAPLDQLVGWVEGAGPELTQAAGQLRHNTVHMVGVGYEAPREDEKSWLYFPDPAVPFYRATNFAKYSPRNVPGGDTERFSAYMTETASSPERPLPPGPLPERVERALRESGVVSGRPRVASIHVEEIDYAYPVPTLGRDRALARIQPWLTERDIFSRGRFGAWRYEIGNMDHAVKMGIDVARRLVRGDAEELFGTDG